MNLSLQIANPLPAALSHYVKEVSQTLTRINIQSNMLLMSPVESRSISNAGKLPLFSNALKNPLRARGIRDPVFVTWPSLGLWDAQFWRSRHASRLVVLHDPIPIRSQFGFDFISKKIATLPGSNLPVIVSHSDDALTVAMDLLPRHRHLKLLHPVLSSEDRKKSPQPKSQTVVVAGQYKPERDIELLKLLGPLLKSIAVEGKIYGSGWPLIPGWDVDARFLSEAQLDTVLADAAVVLIPYKRYYQSGVAIRALEAGTMSLSPANSFASDVFGPTGIVRADTDPTDWLRAIRRIIHDGDMARNVFRSYRTRVDENWSQGLAQLQIRSTGASQ